MPAVVGGKPTYELTAVYALLRVSSSCICPLLPIHNLKSQSRTLSHPKVLIIMKFPLPQQDELKQIIPFINRGNEMYNVDPVISYYCVYYALKLAISNKNRGKEANAYLASLMDAVEQTKKLIATHEAITNEVVGQAMVENFATRIFNKADDEDRAGMASKKTAVSFLASALFFEVLGVFGEYEQSIVEKIRYSKWKAADITKALREGRKPVPGSPVKGENDASIEGAGEEENGAEAIDSPTVATASPVPKVVTSPTTTAASVPPPIKSPVTVSHVTNLSSTQERAILDPVVSDQTQKHCRYVISALQYDDVPTAIENLEKALALLRPLHKSK